VPTTCPQQSPLAKLLLLHSVIAQLAACISLQLLQHHQVVTTNRQDAGAEIRHQVVTGGTQRWLKNCLNVDMQLAQ
jgi:hypothetical protein